MLRNYNAIGLGVSNFHNKSVRRFNVISITNEWVGVKCSGKNNVT